MTDLQMVHDVAAEYVRIRREHPWLPASQAILWARGNLKPLTLEWETFEGNHFAVGRGERDGFDITVYVDYDSWGGVGDFPTPTDDNTGIRNPNFDRDAYRGDATKPYLELVSGYTLPQLAADYRKQGDAKGVAWERARESLQDEAEGYLSDDYVQLVFRAVASVGGAELGEGALGSDLIIDYKTLERELDNTVAETDIIEQAIEEAKVNLPALVTKIEAVAGHLTT